MIYFEEKRMDNLSFSPSPQPVISTPAPDISPKPVENAVADIIPEFKPYKTEIDNQKQAFDKKEENKEEIVVIYGNGTWRDIPVSQKRIPEKREDIVAAQAQRPATPQPEKKYHTIKSGDTLYALAVFYKTKVSEICRLNGIKETDVLKLGTKLRVK